MEPRSPYFATFIGVAWNESGLGSRTRLSLAFIPDSAASFGRARVRGAS